MDFEKYSIKLNVKTICMFEQLSGKNFLKCLSDDDGFLLMYCSLVSNNDVVMTFDAFKILLKNKKIGKWISDEYGKILKFIMQMNRNNDTPTDKEENDVDFSIRQMANTLIVRYHIDAHYVMYDMHIWEMVDMFKEADEMKKEELEEKRFWTYLTIAPHIDSKKIKSPEDLIQFAWDKDRKTERGLKQIDDNKELINRIFGGKKDG